VEYLQSALADVGWSAAAEDPAAGTGRFIDRFGPVAW
jgi:hypothetical protein